MAKKNSLTKDDWIKASFRALSAAGPQAIKAESLARALQVSKGSFYWHFDNVLCLKEAMLQRWVQVATEDIISAVREHASGAKEQIRLLIQIATSDRSEPYGGKLAEAGIRDWARYDENAAATLKAVDSSRLKFLQTLFEEHGASSARATTHAKLLYGALIGLEQLSHRGMADLNVDLSVLLELLLAE